MHYRLAHTFLHESFQFVKSFVSIQNTSSLKKTIQTLKLTDYWDEKNEETITPSVTQLVMNFLHFVSIFITKGLDVGMNSAEIC